MATAAPPRPPFQAQQGLRWLTGFAAFGVGLSALYATTGIGFGCPFRMLTGWDCPFCGGTRLGSALLHGDGVAAFWFNPASSSGWACSPALGLVWLIELLGGSRVRLPIATGRRLSAVRSPFVGGGGAGSPWFTRPRKPSLRSRQLSSASTGIRIPAARRFCQTLAHNGCLVVRYLDLVVTMGHSSTGCGCSPTVLHTEPTGWPQIRPQR